MQTRRSIDLLPRLVYPILEIYYHRPFSDSYPPAMAPTTLSGCVPAPQDHLQTLSSRLNQVDQVTTRILE